MAEDFSSQVHYKSGTALTCQTLPDMRLVKNFVVLSSLAMELGTNVSFGTGS